MGLNTWIRDLVRTTLVSFGGTISVPGEDELYPIAISNELLGGAHGYRTLEELANVPKLRLQRPMLATVLRHVRPDGKVFKRSTMVFDPTDEILEPFMENVSLERISDISGYDLSIYWKPIDPDDAASANNTIESQYADSQDYGRVGDPGSPAFQAPLISTENYQSGFKSDEDETVIWGDTYNPSVHKYERQRLGENGNWGIPKLINATTYSQGDYIDNRFIWVDKDEIPTRPPSLVGGLSNGEPAGWENTPVVPGGEEYYDYIVDHDLFRISASKDAFGNLKSEWGTPIKISTDPNLVRYGNNPSSTDFIGVGGTDTADWRGYFTPGTDTHMATRVNESSQWRIQNIDNEEGSYVDYIFKAFKLSDEPGENERPTIANPFSDSVSDFPNNLWKDYPFQVETDEILYRSVGRKYNNGTLKPSGWSIPTRSDGKDTIQVVIEPVGQSMFKYDGGGNVTPSTIVLKAKLYRGNEEVTPDTPFQWYKGQALGEYEIIKDSIVGPSQYHVISGTNNDTLTISPAAIEANQTYTLKGVLSGEDYFDPISILDVTDGIGIIPVIQSTGGFVYKNAAGEKTFSAELYINGVQVVSGMTYQWKIGSTNLGTSVNQIVNADDFVDEEVLSVDITYDGETYTRSESIVDLNDAPAVIIEYSSQFPLPVAPGDQVWTLDPTGAYYMRMSNDGGATFSAPIRVRGESAPYNGGFQKSAYKNASGQPTATGVASNLLPSSAGWTAQPTDPGPGEYVWEVTAFFAKNPATSNTEFTDANWSIEGTWSVAIRKTGVDGDQEGPQGDPGPVGWSPVFAIVTVNATKEILQVVNWTNLGGADPGTKPSTGYYVGASGFTTDANAAKNIKGSQGPDTNSRPQYYVQQGARTFATPSTLFNYGWAPVYLTSAFQVKNEWTQSRWFRVLAECPVSNDNNSDSWACWLLSSSTASFPSGPASATKRDVQYSRQDFVNYGPKSVHKVKLDYMVFLSPGSSMYFRTAMLQIEGGNSYYSTPFVEAFGI